MVVTFFYCFVIIFSEYHRIQAFFLLKIFSIYRRIDTAAIFLVVHEPLTTKKDKTKPRITKPRITLNLHPLNGWAPWISICRKTLSYWRCFYFIPNLDHLIALSIPENNGNYSWFRMFFLHSIFFQYIISQYIYTRINTYSM